MTSSLNVSGSWTLTDCCTSFNVVLNQDQASNITGSVDVSASDLCDSYDKAVWPISGAVTGSNTFSFTATNPGVSNSDCYAVWQIDATTTSDTTATAEFDLLLDDGPHLIGNMTRKPVPIKLIDPVASGLIDGEAVTQNVDAIAAAPNPIYVAGVSADGVSQVIIEVTHVQPGDSVQLTLVNENGQQDSTANDGGLIPLGGSPANAASTLTFQAQNTNPPMAIAVWLGSHQLARKSGRHHNSEDFDDSGSRHEHK